MKQLFNTSIICGTIFIITLFSSCEKKYYVAPTEEIKNVSFSTDMQPFFDNNCVTNCHDGNRKPDLRSDFSWNALIDGTDNSGNKYVDTDNDESSILYTKIILGESMQQYATPVQRTMTLVWIQEGAKDN